METLATIDTAILSISAAKITPVSVQRNFPNMAICTHLGIRLTFDNLINRAVVSWELLENENTVTSGIYIIEGDEYAAWTGDNIYPFGIIATALGLTFI